MSKTIINANYKNIYNKMLNNILEKNGFEVYDIQKNSEQILNLIKTKNPYVIILPVRENFNEFMGFIRYLNDNYKKLKIIVIFYDYKSGYYDFLEDSNIWIYLKLPFSPIKICEKIVQEIYIENFTKYQKFLIKNGFSESSSGFGYLCCAMELCSENPEYLSHTMSLYSAVSEKTGKTSFSIERNIRYYLKNPSNMQNIIKFTGNSYTTNSKFIKNALNQYIEKEENINPICLNDE